VISNSVPSGTVTTVLGEIDARNLGRTDYHEHLFQATPLLPGDELDDEDSSRQEAALLRESGFDAMIDATPTGLGRNPAAVARISRATGVHVVATTGAHREAHYASGHWLLELSAGELSNRFTHDVQVGAPVHDASGSAEMMATEAGLPVRAGVLKAGIGYWGWTAFERRVLAAVADAHARTGAPVMVHLEHGSAAFELLDVLASDGVRPEAVLLAHVDRNPDPGLHAELAAAGAYLGYDGFARTRDWPDSMLIDCLVRSAELGATDRLMIGGDVARRTRYVAYGGRPGLAYVGRRVVPRLVQAGYADLVEAVLVRNPARYLSTASRSANRGVRETLHSLLRSAEED
jgi:predicted metal-dependent phosphotriesterase family hydrolase